jgi:hypothetical protein
MINDSNIKLKNSNISPSGLKKIVKIKKKSTLESKSSKHSEINNL